MTSPLTGEAKKRAIKRWAKYAKARDRASLDGEANTRPPSPLSDPIGAAKARRAKFAKQIAFEARGEKHSPWWYARTRPLKG